MRSIRVQMRLEYGHKWINRCLIPLYESMEPFYKEFKDSNGNIFKLTIERERMKNPDAILAPARAIVQARPMKGHSSTAKSMRTYYLWETGRVSQRKPPSGLHVTATVRAGTTERAMNVFRAKGFVLAYKEK